MTPRHLRPTPLKNFLFGAPYYPEHWNEAERRLDRERMQTAGVNVVRMAEFAWDCVEPEPGVFDFQLFDQTIEHLGQCGIQTILCTPTAAPPRWLSLQHPEWMRVDQEGRSMRHGSRQHFCTNQPGFRKASERITRAMTQHYAENPHVIGWQTDNEFHCHINECYCSACLQSFQEWLQTKYGQIGQLNAAWGSAFWAQSYRAFGEIPFPYPNRPTHANPGQQLDYYRFLSDSLIAFQSGQIAEIRKANPAWWVSHNGTFDHIDHWQFAEELDFYGVDVYPGFSHGNNAPEPDPAWASLKLEDCRSARGNFVVFEQQAGAGGQHPYLLPTPRPGQMRLWAWQSIAHGADGILHFRWRTCRYGAEIYWNGILDHDNVPRRRFEEFSKEGAELRRIGPRILGTVPQVDIGILVEQDQDEAHQSMPLGQTAPWHQRKAVLRELQVRHLACGLVQAADSFTGIRALFMPGFALMDLKLASKLKEFVRQGGILIATARTATRTRDNQVSSETAPCFLQECFGLTVEENGTHEPLRFTHAGKTYPTQSYYEILQALPGDQTEVLATWNELEPPAPHCAPGQAALTVHPYGRGHAIYLGTSCSNENLEPVIDQLMAISTLQPLAKANSTVQIACRQAETRRLLFLLNHSGSPQLVSGLPECINLVDQKKVSGECQLSGYELAVLDLPTGLALKKSSRLSPR
ncbi:beta-galactosidase [Coraliomargarita parva]|uniref:beta-galactosidase n=1 Tax=Coraliomargarita parva TaxID=3014050 RepID=UPI0022B2FFC2|nr:beta-galactosidase [Coraliomargarita parva]